MKIVADENVAYRIIKSLRLRGYEIISISEDKPSIPDNNVLHFANEQNAILLTEDSDLGELVFTPFWYLISQACGINCGGKT